MDKLTKPVDLVETVKNSLFDAILKGSLVPGEKLKQEKLAEQLGVSRQPVSHALRILADQGILTGANSQSLTVAKLDKRAMQQVISVRIELDSYAAQEAARRFREEDISEAEMETINQLNMLIETNMQECAQGVKRSVQDDITFHSLIRELSGNPFINASLAPHLLHHHRLIYLIGSQRVFDIWGDHRAIVTAITAGEVKQARQLTRDHITRGSKALFENWEILGLT